MPAGLADLSGALRAIADFLEIDEDLTAVAAEASPALKDEPDAGLADWIATLPAAEKDKLLTMVADGEGHAGPGLPAATLPRRTPWTRTRPPDRPDGRPAVVGGRGTQDRPRGGRGAGPRAEAERVAAAKAAAYNKRLDHLATRAEAAWQEVADLIETKKPRDYDQAVSLLRDLSALARRDGDHDSFTARLLELRSRHERKPSLQERFDKAGFPRHP